MDRTIERNSPEFADVTKPLERLDRADRNRILLATADAIDAGDLPDDDESVKHHIRKAANAVQEADVRQQQVRALLQQWGIKDLRHASELETLVMLYTNQRLVEEAQRLEASDARLSPLLLDELTKRLGIRFGFQQGFPWLSAWRDSGYARMHCGHKLAAALMMTTAPDTALFAPWQAWSLYVPDGLLPMQFSLAGIERVQQARKAGLSTILELGAARPGEEPISSRIQRIWCNGSHAVSVVMQLHAGSGKEITCMLGLSEDCSGPTVTLLNNYVKGVCLMLDHDVERSHRTGVWGPKTSKRRTGKEPGVGAQYELSSPVQIDLRETVKQFLSEPGGGTHASPKFQFLVRGHWRWQPYGPGRVDRKHKWIEPFWKGPEEARVLLRAHTLKKD